MEGCVPLGCGWVALKISVRVLVRVEGPWSRNALENRHLGLGGEGRNRTPNVLLTLKIDRFFRLIKHYPPLHLNYTFTTFLLALPLTVDLLTNRDAAAQKCSAQRKRNTSRPG